MKPFKLILINYFMHPNVHINMCKYMSVWVYIYLEGSGMNKINVKGMLKYAHKNICVGFFFPFCFFFLFVKIFFNKNSSKKNSKKFFFYAECFSNINEAYLGVKFHFILSLLILLLLLL